MQESPLMPFPFRRSSSQVQSKSAGRPGRLALVRIIGNDLPPRHEPGQTLKNLRFILDHESELQQCSKRWILNRIADPRAEAAIAALLDERRQAHARIEFRPEEFARLRAETVRRPADDLGPEAAGRLKLRAERPRLDYAIPINRARNLALRESDADWTLPFDGNCFVTAAAWADIREGILAHPAWRYVVVPMARVTSGDDILAPGFRPAAEGEPQVAFRRDAPLAFDEAYSYGRRDKVELLWRLGLPGPWDRWKDDPWDLPRTRRAAAKGEVGTAGRVIRLSSGRDALERGPNADRARNDARANAILDFLASLDRRVLAESLGTT